MANWSRAFESLGQALLPLAQNAAQRERDAALAMREENLMRLQQKLRMEADTVQFGQQKELIGIEAGVRAGERQLEQDFTRYRDEAGMKHERELLDTRMKHERSLLSIKEGDGSFKNLQALEKSYSEQLNAIDKRMAEVQDKLIEQQADAQTQGLELDSTLLKPWQDELSRLQEQRRQLGRQRDLDLARLDPKRYATLTAEEVQRELAAAKAERGSDVTAAQAPAAKGSAAAKEAANRSSVDEVPPPPPKPKGMIEREARKKRDVVPRGKAELGPIGRHFSELDLDTPPPKMSRGGPIPLKNVSSEQLRKMLKTATPSEAARIQAELRKRGVSGGR